MSLKGRIIQTQCRTIVDGTGQFCFKKQGKGYRWTGPQDLGLLGTGPPVWGQGPSYPNLVCL